ncbi:MAG: hypothetical protein V1735_07255, partial [Nanoarchaeota archaeon]
MRAVTFLLALCVIPFAFANPVGYDQYNASVIKFWNSGPVENETFISTDLVQIANAPERFGWGSYEDCLFAFQGDDVQKVCVEDLGRLNPQPQSDNLTFWSYGGFVQSPFGNLGKSFSQHAYDSYVNRTIFWNASVSSNRDWWLGFCIKDINIDLDGDADVINFEDGGQFVSLNKSSLTYLSLNVTSDSVLVGDLDSASGIEWKFADGEGNGVIWDGSRLCVLDFVGRGGQEGVRQSSFEWVDAPTCTLSTLPGCVFSGVTYDFLSDESSVNASVWLRFGVLYSCNNILGCSGIPLGQSCNNNTFWGAGCFVASFDDTQSFNGSSFTETNGTEENDPFLRCSAFDYPQCKMDNLSYNGGNTSWFSLDCYTAN